MPINVGFLPQDSSLMRIRIKKSFRGLTKLVSIICTGTLLFPVSVMALDSSQPATQKNRREIPNRFYPEPKLSPDQVRLMTQELTGLINRFSVTLLTADASQSDIELSTAAVVEQLLKSETVANKQHGKYASSKYKNSHLALQLGTEKLHKFRYLVAIGRYQDAKAEWSAAKKILWSNYPQNPLMPQSEVRAMWFDRGTIVKAKSEADLVEIFDRMAIAGINTVFFETLNSSYTIYPSKVAPEQNPLVKGWDPLQAAVKLAHERDMELHAWIWTFAAVNKRHNKILNLPSHYLGPVLSQHPEWAMTDQQGSRFHYNSGKVFLDPANSEVRDYLQALIAEIAEDYDVDGIHLDYIRYPFQSPTGHLTYGYGIASREKFHQATGYDPVRLNPDHPLWSRWIQFRAKQVDTFVQEVSQQLQNTSPELTLSAAVFPLPNRDRLSKIQQEWETWVTKEWIDMLVPMTYSKSAQQLYAVTNPLLKEFTQGKALLLPGIRLLNMSEVAAFDQMQLLRGLSTEGYSLFAAENLNSRMSATFQETQGERSGDRLPHREPFQATLSRYRSLQQEWNFYLATNPGEIDDATLIQWSEQADLFNEQLQKFIDEPSNRNLFSVKMTLDSLRQDFPDWVEQSKNLNLYQAQVWQNRLDTLDRLLNYGARKKANY